MLYNRCTGIYKFGNNTYPQRIRRRSNLGHIFREKSASYWPGNTVIMVWCSFVPCRVVSYPPSGATPGGGSGSLSTCRWYWGNKIPRADLKTALRQATQRLSVPRPKWQLQVGNSSCNTDYRWRRNIIGTAIHQKTAGEDDSHRVGCRTALWKERKNHHIMI